MLLMEKRESCCGIDEMTGPYLCKEKKTKVLMRSIEANSSQLTRISTCKRRMNSLSTTIKQILRTHLTGTQANKWWWNFHDKCLRLVWDFKTFQAICFDEWTTICFDSINIPGHYHIVQIEGQPEACSSLVLQSVASQINEQQTSFCIPINKIHFHIKNLTCGWGKGIWQ